VARVLDRARDGRRVLTATFVLYGLLLVAVALLIGHVPVPLVAALVIFAGTSGPLLTGGLSSRLASLVDPDERAQRRAQGWDAVTYGIGGTAGPAAVAAMATLATPRLSVVVLGITAGVAGMLALTLPAAGGRGVPKSQVPLVRQTLRLIATRGPLRRVTYATIATAMPGGAIAVLAIARSGELGAPPASGAAMAAAFGLGNLLGSLVMTAFPQTGEPERLSVGFAAGIGVGFAVCAAAPTVSLGIVAFGLLGVLNAPFFTATLAARSVYAPEGARAQVFVSMAGLKIAAAAVGTAVAGALVVHGSRLLLCAGAVLIFTGTAAMIIDRRWAARSRPGSDQSMNEIRG
jgi:hypothetical protein